MTALEKQLLTRVAILERRVADILVRTGMDAAAMDAYRYEEAIDHMARTGDPSLIKSLPPRCIPVGEGRTI